MTRIEECILYRDFEQGEILKSMTKIMEAIDKGQDTQPFRKDFYTALSGLVELAGAYGFSGNLWQ